MAQPQAAGGRDIILGTASSFRRTLMDELAAEYGFSYTVSTAGIDEKAIREPDPRALVVALAHAKADAIIARLRSGDEVGAGRRGVLITCDQVVVHMGRILEKPEDEAQAREYIAGYGTAPASTVSSLLATDLESGRRIEAVDVVEIHFTPIPEEAADLLLSEGDCMYCAGGLMVEHPAVAPHVLRVDGSMDSVMGLPREPLLCLLRDLSALPPAAPPPSCK